MSPLGGEETWPSGQMLLGVFVGPGNDCVLNAFCTARRITYRAVHRSLTPHLRDVPTLSRAFKGFVAAQLLACSIS